MKVLNKARLDALERALKSKDGVLVVEQVEGGYELPSGEIVNDLAPLHKTLCCRYCGRRGIPPCPPGRMDGL